MLGFSLQERPRLGYLDRELRYSLMRNYYRRAAFNAEEIATYQMAPLRRKTPCLSPILGLGIGALEDIGLPKDIHSFSSKKIHQSGLIEF